MSYSEGTTPTIAITGAAGFIGSRVLGELQSEHSEWDVRALDNFYLGDVRTVGDVTVDHVDIRNRDRLEAFLSGADVVLHLAAVSGVDDCKEDRELAFETNVQGTENVAWFCRKSGAALVFPFSMAVVGDPVDFPITVDHDRNPMNWYGRTKLLGERAIDTLAADAYPAHCYLMSNLYGTHKIDGEQVGKPTVINFFLQRALDEKPLTVYRPGSQARNYVHVGDVARAYLRSCEQLLTDLEADETGVTEYEIASREDPSVMDVAQLVQRIAREETDLDPDVELVDNPREETLVEAFEVDISRAASELDWRPGRSIEETVRAALRNR